MKNDHMTDSGALRHKAELLLKKKQPQPRLHMAEGKMLKLLHELEVHQIELELQNDELIRARSDARVSADKYAALYDFAPTGLFTLSNRGEITQLNLSGTKMIGRERSYIMNKRFGVFVSADTRPVFNQFLDEAFKSNTTENCEVALSIPGSPPMYIHLTGIVAQNGQECLVTAIDITERRHAAEILRQSERKYRNLVENINEVIYEVDEQGILKYISSSVEKIVGYNPVEIVGRDFKDFVGENAEYLAKRLLELSDKIEIDNEYKILTKTGEIRWIRLSTRAIFENGVFRGGSGTLINITEKKLVELELHESEEALKVLNAELEKRIDERTGQLITANEQLEEFTYSISHDLHAPLRHINGFIGLLKEMETGHRSEDELKYMDIISKGAGEMSQLIDALLSFSRLSRAELRKTSINTRAMVDQVISFCHQETEHREIVYKLGQIHDCEGDDQLIRQVWINLISNAIKYTGRKAEAVIEVGSTSEGGMVTYFVKDNGAGFDMQYAGKLFGVFQRLHKPCDFEGVGIGLANVSSIVARHGGVCSAQGEVGKGAVFTFSLPA